MSTTNRKLPTIEFSEHILSNGLPLILHRDTKVPAVCINIAYHVGSKNETPSRAGFAHLFEHLLFEGSKNVPKGMFDEYITRAGGNNNAYTTEDKTNYYMTLPSTELELGLWLESDRMLECVVTEESLATQKDVVIEEKRERYDNAPYGSLSERMMRLSYKTYPYKWTVIGDMQSIRAATLEDVHDFFNTFYVPSNATLSITGNIDIDETIRLAEQYFGSIHRPSLLPPLPLYQEKYDDGNRRDVVTTEDVPLPAVFWTYHIAPDGSQDTLAMDLLTDILSTGQSSKMYRQLVHDKRIASDISAYIDVREMPGLVWLNAIGSNPGTNPDDIEAALTDLVDDLLKNGITERELEKAKNRAEMRTVSGRLRISTKADILAHSHRIYHETDKVNTLLSQQQQLTINDVMEAAHRSFIASERCSVIYHSNTE